jgi:3-hydroxyisobutyrate dehydrogenase-like beta-hydroxyacid dehydrogenase
MKSSFKPRVGTRGRSHAVKLRNNFIAQAICAVAAEATAAAVKPSIAIVPHRS